jgi:hypothetical protein
LWAIRCNHGEDRGVGCGSEGGSADCAARQAERTLNELAGHFEIHPTQVVQWKQWLSLLLEAEKK